MVLVDLVLVIFSKVKDLMRFYNKNNDTNKEFWLFCGMQNKMIKPIKKVLDIVVINMIINHISKEDSEHLIQ